MTTPPEPTMADPQSDLSALGWDDLLAEIVTISGELQSAKDALRADKKEYESGIVQAQSTIQRLQQREAALRETLKLQAVAAIVRAANGGRTIGAIKLPYKPQIRVLDVSAAAVLLDGVCLVAPNGEMTTLVEWRPTINEDAARLLIEALEGTAPLKVLRAGETAQTGGALDLGAIVGLTDAAREAFTSPQLLEREARAADKTTVRGWVGAIVLTRKDDPASYVLQINTKLLTAESPASTDDDRLS